MDQKKQPRPSPKKYLLVAFVFAGFLLVMADLGKNLVDEIHTTSEFKNFSEEQATPQPTMTPTLSEEEMKRWAERLEKTPNS